MRKEPADGYPGVALDAGMQAFNDTFAAAMPAEAKDWPLAQQRLAWNTLCRSFHAPHPPGLRVEDILCNTVPCRLFRPEGDRPVPIVIYGHGGGFVFGGPDTHDDMCAEMAAFAEVGVVLMDYRLAPEHPFPAQLEDSLKVWRWLRERGGDHNLDATRIVAAGDSVGGQISSALIMALHELGLPPVQGCVLMYPLLGTDLATPSSIRHGNAPGLTRDDMAFYLRSFLGPEGGPNWFDPKAVPNLAGDVSCFPPTYMTVAAHDPLHDDGTTFHGKLLAANVPVLLREETALAHSYLRARHHSEPAKKGFDAIVKALRSLAWEGGLPVWNMF
jgi:acetyl esterase